MTIQTYMAIALVALAVDAAFCYAARRRLRLIQAVCMAALWPLSLPLAVLAAAAATRAFPDWPNIAQRLKK